VKQEKDKVPATPLSQLVEASTIKDGKFERHDSFNAFKGQNESLNKSGNKVVEDDMKSENSVVIRNDQGIKINNYVELKKLDTILKKRSFFFKDIDVALQEDNIAFNDFQALFCFSYFKCCYRKQVKKSAKLFTFGVTLLKEKLDVTSLIKAYQDIDKIKYVFMTTEQLILFDLIKNPKLEVDMQHQDSKNIETLRDYMLNQKNLRKYDKAEIELLFSKLLKEEDIISKKILLAHSYHV